MSRLDIIFAIAIYPLSKFNPQAIYGVVKRLWFFVRWERKVLRSNYS
ncbi:MAG: hypothetical protein ACFCAD_21425 [Pleurocapsa sp.]